jgi:hypothetical protein
MENQTTTSSATDAWTIYSQKLLELLEILNLLAARPTDRLEALLLQIG